MFKIVFRAKGTLHFYNSGEWSDDYSSLLSIKERLALCNPTYEYRIDPLD